MPPESPAAETSPRGDKGAESDTPAYFRENGYAVARGLIPGYLCDEAVAFFRSEVKPYKGHIYRQASVNPERNEFDAGGHVLNSILNPVSVSPHRFPGFRNVSHRVLTHGPLFESAEAILKERAVLVQSMYFEGNPATWPHQDCYYLDSEREGALMGAWIALEDIDEAAGCFYVVPGSHRMDFGRNAGPLNIARNHDEYKRRVKAAVDSGELELRAPALRRGDVLFWSSRTLHGAFEPKDPKYSRNSYTAHFIPASGGFVQYQCIPVRIDPVEVNGRLIYRPKDQDKMRNRLVMKLEMLLPSTFQHLKRTAIDRKIRRYTQRRAP